MSADKLSNLDLIGLLAGSTWVYEGESHPLEPFDPERKQKNRKAHKRERARKRRGNSGKKRVKR